MTRTRKCTPPPAYGQHNLNRPQVKGEEALREKNAERAGDLTISSWGAFLHMVKSGVGSGLLAMPFAFHNIGLLGGLIGITLATITCGHCMHMVVKCSQELCWRRGKTHMTYVETVETAFLVGAGGRLRAWSSFMKYMASSFMFVSYFGVNTAYVIFIGHTSKQVLESNLGWSMDVRFYILLQTVVLLPVGIVRHMKLLVPFSLAANILQMGGFLVTIYLCFIDIPSLSTRPLFQHDVSRWPIFFATSMFGMEGIGTVMPIENAMRKPADFLRIPGVLTNTMVVIGSLFLLVGSVGYVKFGDDVAGSITLNLARDWASELVKVCVAVGVLLSYPLQLTASIEIVWGGVSTYFSEKHQDSGYYFFRALLILANVLTAAAVPTLGPFTSLFGAIGFSGLGILVPSVTELVTFGKPSPVGLAKHSFLLVIYVVSLFAGTFASVQGIVREFSIH